MKPPRFPVMVGPEFKFTTIRRNIRFDEVTGSIDLTGFVALLPVNEQELLLGLVRRDVLPLIYNERISDAALDATANLILQSVHAYTRR